MHAIPTNFAKTIMSIVILIFVATLPMVKAAEVKIAWQAEFNSKTEKNGSVVLFEGRGGGELPAENRICKISDGSLTFGLDPASNLNRHNMIWGKNIWWAQAQTPDWGPWDLKEYPIIEVKYRPVRSILFYFDVTDNSGNRDAFYAYGNSWPKKKVTDERGEWTVATIRLSPDSSVPKIRTIRYLNGLNLCVYGRDSRHTVEVDYIRIRGPSDDCFDRTVARYSGDLFGLQVLGDRGGVSIVIESVATGLAIDGSG